MGKNEHEAPAPEEIERLKAAYPGLFERFGDALPDDAIAMALAEYERLSKEELFSVLLGMTFDISMVVAAIPAVRELLADGDDDPVAKA